MITVDTNVFVYAAQASDKAKQATSAKVLARLVARRAPLALQVVGEFQHVAGRKLSLRPGQVAEQGRAMLTAFDIFAATPRAAARVIAERSVLMLGYWDALLLSAAAEAGCRTLVSEDMTSGETYFGVRVVSPFDPAGRPSPAIIDLLEL